MSTIICLLAEYHNTKEKCNNNALIHRLKLFTGIVFIKIILGIYIILRLHFLDCTKENVSL